MFIYYFSVEAIFGVERQLGLATPEAARMICISRITPSTCRVPSTSIAVAMASAFGSPVLYQPAMWKMPAAPCIPARSDSGWLMSPV